jgi:hypothetical protein
MTERVTRLDLCIAAGPEADTEELAVLAVQLREQLLELDIESAEPTTWVRRRQVHAQARFF